MIYFIRCHAFVKIGFSTYPNFRGDHLQTGCPYDLHTMAVVEGSYRDETYLHSRFAHLRHRGEWFWLRPEIEEVIRDGWPRIDISPKTISARDIVEIEGATKTVGEWARINGISISVVNSRGHRGWCAKDAVTIKPRSIRPDEPKREALL